MRFDLNTAILRLDLTQNVVKTHYALNGCFKIDSTHTINLFNLILT